MISNNFKNAERLNSLAESGIGLGRGDLRLEKYDPSWKRRFSEEAYFIFDEVRNESLRLYHIGSTSVPGLDSKPIIDILGSVASLVELDQQRTKFESIGYEYKGEYGIQGRRYCVLYNPQKTTGYIHLHIFEHGNAEVQKHLAFRDWLRESDAARETYLTRKKYLIDELKIERSQYSQEKGSTIEEIQSNVESKKIRQKVMAVIGAAEGHKNTLDTLNDIYRDSQIEIVDLNISPISPYSYLNSSKDHFQKIIEGAIAADVLVLATPVYWYAMSGSMKNFMDRFSNLMSGESKPLGEALYGKKLQLISTGYDSILPLGFEVPFAGTAIYFGMDYLGSMYKSVRS